MKKIRWMLAILLLVTFTAGCDQARGQRSDQADLNMLPLFAREDYFIFSEFGESRFIIRNEGPLGVFIRYPQGNLATDAIISNWVEETYVWASTEFGEVLLRDRRARGELNIQFDSFFVGERFAGIIKRGYFTHSRLDGPIYITETFNFDTVDDIALSNEHILDVDQIDAVLDLLREKLDVAIPGYQVPLEDVDAGWLSHLVIGHEGVIVLLARSVHLPAHLGSALVTLSYEELGDAFLLWEDSAFPTEPEDEEPRHIGPFPVAPPREIDLDRPMIALTFDDGPSRYTDQILDILERHGEQATFVVLGSLIDFRRETVMRAVAGGNEVISHTWSHRDLTKLNEQEIIAEIQDTSALIVEVTGASPPLMRPPYGANNELVRSVAEELGYALLLWSIDPMDWQHRHPEWIYNTVMQYVRDGAIILLHDIHPSTAQAMETLIPRLIAEGYQLVTASDLIYHRLGPPEPGRIYYSARRQ